MQTGQAKGWGQRFYHIDQQTADSLGQPACKCKCKQSVQSTQRHTHSAFVLMSGWMLFLHYDVEYIIEHIMDYLGAVLFWENFNCSFYYRCTRLSHKPLKEANVCLWLLANKYLAKLCGGGAVWCLTLFFLSPKTLQATCRMSREELK